MARYSINGSWSVESDSHGVRLECADLRDDLRGDVFRDGAYRVLVDGKPIRGKGGTVPFKGESAWSDGERKASDLRLARIYASD